jgi:hypothetical protein
MALDFTQIKDEPGPAIFIIHDGSDRDVEAMTRLAEEIRTKTTKQIIILSAVETVGRSIIEFYQLTGSHFVLIVRDDDQLHATLSNGDLFDASQIVYLADQAG